VVFFISVTVEYIDFGSAFVKTYAAALSPPRLIVGAGECGPLAPERKSSSDVSSLGGSPR
jgi:hypothetical protein